MELLKVLDSSDVIRAENEKLLIFTEHKDTLKSLTSRLEDKGYTVETIRGGMDVDSRKNAQRQFLTRAKIMVATDAAGEGINLQFCRYLINWDIPWNPNRLEQRMGRIHRYGQRDDVRVYNLVAQNTREGAVLQTVLHKMDVMRDQMGSDRVYDVIDDWLEGVPLVNLMEKAIDSEDATEARKETEERLGTASKERAEHLVALQKKSSLASRLDLRAARDLRDASDERRLQPLFIQRFFERAWTACGGTVRKDEHFPVWHLGPTPVALLDLARVQRISIKDRYDTPFVFDKQLVSVASKIKVPDRTKLLGPGHVLFDALIKWAIRESRQAFAKGTYLVDPNLASLQRLWLVRSTIQDGRLEDRKRLAHERLTVIAADHMGLRFTSPSYLLNCLPPEGSVEPPVAPDHCTEEIQAWAYEEITEKQLAHVTAGRQEECKVRREYLENAFTDLILELQEDLSELQHTSLFGDDDAEERERLHKRIEELKVRKVERMKELDLMLNLTANLNAPEEYIVPEINGPLASPNSGSHRSINIELYNFTRWGQLFTRRQLVVMDRFVRCLHEAVTQMEPEITDANYRKALTIYLALWLDRVAAFNNSFTRWRASHEKSETPFSGQSIPMMWDYPEVNPFADSSGTASTQLEYMLRVIRHEPAEKAGVLSARIILGSATELVGVESDSSDSVVTDPPYGNSIAYADLSDFFYVWLKRSLGDLMPEVFRTPQTPKEQEATSHKHRHDGSQERANKFYQKLLVDSFRECKRAAKDPKLVTIMFAHQSTAAWTALLSAVFGAGLSPDATWPIATEMPNTALALGTASLETSVTVACRPRVVGSAAAFRDVRKEIEKVVQESVKRFWSYGFRGADLIVACYGPAVGVFGKYERVEKADGTPVEIPELLELSRQAARDAIAGEFRGDNFSTLYYVWANLYGASEQAWDDARLVVQIGGDADNAMEVARGHGIFVVDGSKCRLACWRTARSGEGSGQTRIRL